MSLSKYRKKRNFKKTPEPPPQMVNTNGKLHFVVQKHDASHLHYDFRLENHGVLKSWAVPKGISTNPHTRRLAVEVEDHPFDYGSFEGTIPEGNYGAGTVMLWDNGEYYVDEHLSKKDNDKKITEDLKKGKLVFYLNGHKLKGLYTLVKIQGGKDNQWLLIKKSDEFADQPIKNDDVSVKTGRSIDEISHNAKRKSTVKKTIPKISKELNLEGAAKASFPKTISPMLATLVNEPFDRKDWIFEVKWDGYRILAEINKKKVRLYSRNDNTYTEKFPDVVRDLTNLPQDMLLDGEMVVVDQEGLSRFQLLQNYLKDPKAGQLIYYVFDILYLNGLDLHRLPLSRRKEILKQVIPQLPSIRLSDYIQDKGVSFYNAAKKNGLEGIIAKNLQSPYEIGARSSNWLKIKAIQEQEAIICGFTQPKGSRKFFGALILGVYKAKELKYIGHAGGGFDFDLLNSIYQKLKPLIVSKCPFNTRPATNAPVTWVKPQLLCQVKFQEWTDDGHMRQPIFLGLREDKKPQEVLQEKPIMIKKILLKENSENKTVDLNLRTPLTNLDKVFWPDDGYTKGDMIRYYQEIAPFIIPHIKNRPLSMHRQPDGINDPGFFQKDINFKTPEWVKIMSLKSETDDEITHYLIGKDKETLALMNNLGCIELNAWCSDIVKPHHPDFLVLDFDPVDVKFPVIVDTVLIAKKIMDHCKMEGFCKTSGSRGIHVYIPLKKKYDFEQTKNFSQILCMAINKQAPEVTSLERSPSKRKGLIYLDYLQNHYASTMAVAYCLRPKPQAPVSAPLEWKEVNRSLKIQDFNIKTMPMRLKKKGDLFKGVFGKGIDMSKSLKILEKFVK